MMNRAEIKKSIHLAFQEENFSYCLTQGLLLEPTELSKIILEKKWFSSLEFSQFLWDEYLIDESSFNELFTSTHAELFLHEYLEQKLSHLDEPFVFTFADKFIDSIRKNRSFLDSKRREELLKLEWSYKFSEHLLAWKELASIHESNQLRLTKEVEAIKNLSLAEVLSFINIWIEKFRFGRNSPERLEELTHLYNYSIVKLLNNLNSLEPVDENSFDQIFAQCLQKHNPLTNFLTNALEFLRFEQSVLDPYCFDLNLIPKYLSGKLALINEDEKVYAYWKQDGIRYFSNSSRYLHDAEIEIEKRISEGELFIPGKDEATIRTNLLFTINNEGIRRFLSELKIDELKFYKKKTSLTQISFAINAYSFNRSFRYEEPIEQLSLKFKDWTNAYITNLNAAHKNGVENLPVAYIYERKSSLEELFKNSIKDIDSSDCDVLIKFFSREIRQYYTLQLERYNVAETPFIKVGDFVFCPISFFNNANLFYTVAQRALKLIAGKEYKHERKSSTIRMENDLAEIFRAQGWNIIIPTDKEVSRIDGDIDICVEDGETQLLIQLKRTIFKLNLFDNLREIHELDLKAAVQLNNAVQFLNEMPGEIVMSKKHFNWIVSSSFENVLQDYNGCKKINYFELIWAVRNKRFESLQELINYIENDGVLKENLMEL